MRRALHGTLRTNAQAASIHGVTDTGAIQSDQHLVIPPYVRLPQRILDMVPHMCLSNHVRIMLLVLALHRLPVEVAGVVNEAICAVILRPDVAMNFL